MDTENVLVYLLELLVREVVLVHDSAEAFTHFVVVFGESFQMIAEFANTFLDLFGRLFDLECLESLEHCLEESEERGG